MNEKTTMQTTTLNNGTQMPMLGLGVFQTPPDVTTAAVREALRAGYRHVDTAAAYENEREADSQSYHIVLRGYRRNVLFSTPEDRRALNHFGIKAMRRYGATLARRSITSRMITGPSRRR